LNIGAALIAVGLGATFFAAELTFRIYPDLELTAIFSNDDSKARAAVSRLLIDPSSAEFGRLRSVEEAEKYVCGDVRAKDKTGQYAPYRAFVYTVASDFARIDDDGLITKTHAAFRTCPLSDEEKVIAQRNLQLSPGTLSLVKSIQKAIPASDPSTLSTIASHLPAGNEGSSGATLEQQTAQMARQLTARLPAARESGSGVPSSSPGGKQQANSAFNAALGNESEWREDRPPDAWPTFPADHPLALSAQKRTIAQALALARDVGERWEQSKTGNLQIRPSSEEIQEACRALLAIDPKNEEFPKAWAAFVRLRKIDHGTPLETVGLQPQLNAGTAKPHD
jgi:hypothetical protein